MLFSFLATPVFAQTGLAAHCRELVLEGEAKQGMEWHAEIGQPAGSAGGAASWLIRLVPVPASGNSGETSNTGNRSRGWGLSVSSAGDQDYPDAVLLASPPYGSLNSREIATTYGMRAQDAIAWSPRHFHFFTSAASLGRARGLYHTLLDPNAAPASRQQASGQLLKLSTDSNSIAAGRLDVLDAHLISGSADPAPFAAQWAAGFGGIPHTLDPDGGKTSLQGELHSLHFKITLWLPAAWKTPAGKGTVPARCAE